MNTKKTANLIWTGDFTSTLEEISDTYHRPGNQLETAGTYGVEITTEYFGGRIDEKDTLAEDTLQQQQLSLLPSKLLSL